MAGRVVRGRGGAAWAPLRARPRDGEVPQPVGPGVGHHPGCCAPTPGDDEAPAWAGAGRDLGVPGQGSLAAIFAVGGSPCQLRLRPHVHASRWIRPRVSCPACSNSPGVGGRSACWCPSPAGGQRPGTYRGWESVTVLTSTNSGSAPHSQHLTPATPSGCPRPRSVVRIASCCGSLTAGADVFGEDADGVGLPGGSTGHAEGVGGGEVDPEYPEGVAVA